MFIIVAGRCTFNHKDLFYLRCGQKCLHESGSYQSFKYNGSTIINDIQDLRHAPLAVYQYSPKTSAVNDNLGSFMSSESAGYSKALLSDLDISVREVFGV